MQRFGNTKVKKSDSSRLKGKKSDKKVNLDIFFVLHQKWHNVIIL